MRFRHRIAFKLAALFLAIGILPMAIVGVFAYWTAKGPMTRTTVEDYVRRVAKDTANRLDTLLGGMGNETRMLATSSSFRDLVTELLESRGDDDAALARIQHELNRAAWIAREVDLLVVARRDGTIVVTSDVQRPSRDDQVDHARYLWNPTGGSNPLRSETLATRPWWPLTRDGRLRFIDVSIEPLVQRAYGYPMFLDDAEGLTERQRRKNPEAYSFGFAMGIPNGDLAIDIGAEGVEEFDAVLVAFYNWSVVQDLLDAVNREFEDEHPRWSTGYTFLFRSDMDTIIGHKDLRNYGTSLIRDHGLASLHRAMAAAKSGSGFFHYTYNKPKISGFAVVKATQWRLGFGINDEEIFSEVYDLRNWLFIGGLFAAGIIVILVAFVSRRFTEPIRELIRQTGEIASGNLDARVDITTRDEIAVLGDSFNKMAEDLKVSNRRLVQAEKTAAWREMARQVAHEIKNPLTPMKLSAQLIERAHADKHPELENIVKDSVGSIITQIESLRRIASDFSSYAAFPKANPKPCSIRRVIEECVALYSNRGASGVLVETELYFDANVEVVVDEDEIRRVFINLFNNAFEAMPDGGRLTITGVVLEHETMGAVVDIRVKDTGIGIPKDIRDRLFEPYFTTRSSGTGLGLAIAKKAVEGYDGRISVHSTDGEGTSVAIILPIRREGDDRHAEDTSTSTG